MKPSRIILLAAAMLLLNACSSSHRPVYSGHEESTEGVPGFKNGKKVSPHVKLGQSYSVDGETYVPRNQPDYSEEGMASWYGPGFHGGKTANGERFDSKELTGAHRTLPLPSIVRVTMLSTGKQVYVRINDRGPFSKSRIIDLSRAAAEKIGLIRVGVAKVRVEYMKEESERFAQLLEQGRDPKSIDVASEVLEYEGKGNEAEYARSDTRRDQSFWDQFSPVSSAQAASPTSTNDAAPVSEVASNDLPAAQPAAGVISKTVESAPVASATKEESSPFDVLQEDTAEKEPEQQMASVEPKPTPAVSNGASSRFVQLGAFSNEANANKVLKQYSQLENLKIVKKPAASGQVLYHVRMGPYTTAEATNEALEKAQEAGASANIIRE